MDFATWLRDNGGIAHRRLAREAGYGARRIKRDIDAGLVRAVGRNWIAGPGVHEDLIAAARVNGRVACVTAAGLRRWWLPESASRRQHFHLATNSPVPAGGMRMHRNQPLVPVAHGQLIESIEDTLQHVAMCCDVGIASVIWESACRVERISPENLRQIAWTSPTTRRLSTTVTGLADSGLETLLIRGLAHLNCDLRAQAFVAGHRVDLLIGDRLIIQVDGQAFHSRAAERARDAAHDAELVLRGYTVLRFTYAQVVHDWPGVLKTVSRAVAQRRHLLPR
ncbi:endonuclease domain-containing protein [Microbacterium nymphoidis]|uniref:endonuclease domain-containing protein n=1 Tax=Microbacterium nymphoidis TaxID=2898586 RepID=UPI001E57DE88|nr:DUF559 domain-containing protein [Microbacterium nymphoidis]MCD2498733.1 endonuclease domain-containing protein [Microbacterium nymphoidis]